jgi:hypothetical protein
MDTWVSVIRGVPQLTIILPYRNEQNKQHLALFAAFFFFCPEPLEEKKRDMNRTMAYA